MERDNRVRDALRLLIGRALDRVQGHLANHLLEGRRGQLELSLTLPLTLMDDELDLAVQAAHEELDEAVHALLVRRSLFRAGCVPCLRCRSTDCAHAQPDDAKKIFAGYAQSGLPHFIDFGEYLLSRQDPRVGELFGERDRLVTRIVHESELNECLLPSIRKDRDGYRIHGQVLAGWYRVPEKTGRRRAMAISFQIVSSKPRRRRACYGLNILGVGPGGETLEQLRDRLSALPWTSAVRWAQSALRTAYDMNSRRVEGLLGGLARRLEKGVRSNERRTGHAQRHHAAGQRPTRMALEDLARAEPDALLVDRRYNTRVVLGQKGRCHVFSPEGRLVTSVRYPTGSIERKRRSGVWRPATPEEILALRAEAERTPSWPGDAP